MTRPKPRTDWKITDRADGREVLRSLVKMLVDGEPMPAEHAAKLARACEQCLEADDGGSLDKQLGLRQRGGVQPHIAEKIRTRDRMLRNLWKQHPDWRALTVAGAATEICKADRVYERRWPRESKHVIGPTEEPAKTFWRIRKMGETVPKVQRLKAILGAQPIERKALKK